jgi:hypothetical protein
VPTSFQKKPVRVRSQAHHRIADKGASGPADFDHLLGVIVDLDQAVGLLAEIRVVDHQEEVGAGLARRIEDDRLEVAGRARGTRALGEGLDPAEFRGRYSPSLCVQGAVNATRMPLSKHCAGAVFWVLRFFKSRSTSSDGQKVRVSDRPDEMTRYSTGTEDPSCSLHSAPA